MSRQDKTVGQMVHDGLKRLKHLSELKEDWNSYGAPPIDIRAIKQAEFLLPLLPDFCIVPTSDGGIQFERHTKTESVEIEISVYDAELSEETS